MRSLLDIQDQLLDTGAAIARAQREMADDPNSFSTRLAIQTLMKQQRLLEKEFEKAADGVGREVCSYRILADKQAPPVAGISLAVADYQALVSITYDAIKNGPKETAKVSATSTEETMFGFGYTYLGSVGFVLTVPNDRYLLGISKLDAAIKTVFEMVSCQSPQDVIKFFAMLGAAPVRSLYKWANDHAKYGLGVEVEWRREQVVRDRVFVQKEQIDALRKALDVTSDEKSEEITVEGVLTAVDTNRGTFRLDVDGGGDIRGKSGNAIGDSNEVVVPKRYVAQLRKITRTRFSTEQDEVEYTLIKLESPLAT